MLKEIIFSILRRLNIVNKLDSQKDFGIKVVCFHSVSDKNDYAYPSMPVKTFENIIKYFSQNYSVILPNDIGKTTPKPKLIITFDDGYKDFIINALPILVKYKIPAIMHVVVNTVLTGENFWTQKIAQAVDKSLETGKILKLNTPEFDKSYSVTKNNAEKIALEIFNKLMRMNKDERNAIINHLYEDSKEMQNIPMMNFDDLKTCLKNNITIGSHSYTHENMALDLDKEVIHTELIESKLKLEEILNTKIECFAFPNGLKNEKLIDILIEAGYKYVFTTEDIMYTPQPKRSE